MRRAPDAERGRPGASSPAPLDAPPVNVDDVDDETSEGPARTRVLLLLLVCGVLLAVASSDALHGALLGALQATEGVVDRSPGLGAALFVVLAAASAVLAFFSSALLVPVAVHAWGVTASVALLWVGWLLGGAFTYAVGRRLGRRVARRLVPPERFDRYEARITERTPWTLVLLLQLALPSEVPGYLLGTVRYPFGRYLLALGVAELPYAVGAVYLGEGLVERRPALLVAFGAAGAVLVVGALRLLRARMRG